MREVCVAYDNLHVSPYKLTYIKDMIIENSINEHALLKLTGIVDDEYKDSYVLNADEEDYIRIYYEKENKSYDIFYGFVTNIKINNIDSVFTISIEAKSLTYSMDLDKVKCDYQDINMTTHEIIDSVMKSYSDAVCSINLPNESIGRYILQYNETNWQFLKRIASFYNQPIITAMEYDKLHIYVGTPEIAVNPKTKIINYKISKNIEQYNDVLKNDRSEVNESDFINYIVKTQEIFYVGENFNFRNRKFYVKKVKYVVTKGRMENIYVLASKGGMSTKYLYNMNIIGVSITGSILEVTRDRVRVNLEIGNTTESEGAYWFPYSTVAASPSGGGWYCMPEKGERIRLNCPTKDETEAFVVNSIDTYEGKSGLDAEGDRMSTTDNKSLQTAAGQEVNFTPSGVNISCSGGQAVANLNSDGTIELNGNTKINISCGNNLTISAKDMKISAEGGKVDISGGSGSSILLEGDEASLKGKVVKNNSAV